MAIVAADLHASPNALAGHYSRFRVGERLLLTGHSHQAWPDRAFEGQTLAFLDAAEHVDEKWDRALAKADGVRRGFAALLGDPDPGLYALGGSTHELLIRFLSALPLARRPRLVTTDGEFHSLRRQLDRLAEEGIEVVKVPSESAEDAGRLAGRLAAAVDDRTAAVLVSAVLFETAYVVRGLAEVAAAARRHGAALLVDAYHALGALPFSLAVEGLEDAWVVGGGYKYLELGEGNCFLRVPPGTTARPVVTGWFAEFAELESAGAPGVRYGRDGDRFAGSTYDPTSHYRACEVFAFFAEMGLVPRLLGDVYRHQVALLAAAFDALDADPGLVRRRREQPLADTGGFLVLESPVAGALREALRSRGVLTDHRGDRLRLGPAPYLSDRQLGDAAGLLGEAVRTLTAPRP